MNRSAFGGDEMAPLCSFGCGKCVRLCFLCVDPQEALRLREMGLCEGAEVRVMRNTDAMIVNVAGSRFGMRRDLAMKVYGTEVAAV